MPPLARSRAARASPRCAPVNAPFSWPNSSLSTSGLGQRRAVERDERPARARRPGVERVRDELLAGAGLARDQHRDVARREPREELEDPHHRRVGDQRGRVAEHELLDAVARRCAARPARRRRARRREQRRLRSAGIVGTRREADRAPGACPIASSIRAPAALTASGASSGRTTTRWRSSSTPTTSSKRSASISAPPSARAPVSTAITATPSGPLVRHRALDFLREARPQRAGLGEHPAGGPGLGVDHELDRADADHVVGGEAWRPVTRSPLTRVPLCEPRSSSVTVPSST